MPYEAPLVAVIPVQTSGVMCQSFPADDNESFGETDFEF